MSCERSEEVMRRYLTEVLRARKLEVINEIASEDMWDHTQPGPGRERLVRHAGGFLDLLPKIQIVINHIVADEDMVVGVWTWRGTPVSEFMGIPLGSEVEGNVTSIFKLTDGLPVGYSLICAVKTTSAPIYLRGPANLVQ